MRRSRLIPFILSSLGASTALAAAAVGNKPVLASIPMSGLLSRRQIDQCSASNICHECFGDGYLVCDNVGCFNPDEHHQCCNNGNLCIGKTNKCCENWGGPGVTGTKGAPTAEPTEEPGNTGFLCTAEDNGEECCQRGGKDIHYCSGKFPRYRCYESTTQWCCTDGSVCDEEGCCDLFNASPTHPWTTGAVPTPTRSSTSSSAGSTGSTTTDSTTTSSVAAEETAADTTEDALAPTSTGGAAPTLRPELLAVGVAALGMALM